jgi:hypothetical protein
METVEAVLIGDLRFAVILSLCRHQMVAAASGIVRPWRLSNLLESLSRHSACPRVK